MAVANLGSSRECYIESYTVTECPNCSKDVSSLSLSGEQQVLCTVKNEGGIQPDFDILPLASEEAYLKTYPEERKGRAFLEFCKEGDVDAVVHLLRDVNAAEEEDIEVLRYQGSFKDVEGSGLHVAIAHNQVEVAWLLLIAGSHLDWSAFPAEVLEAAARFGVGKEDRRNGVDIRSLKNEKGQTACDVAQLSGGVWEEWNRKGWLTA